MKRAISLLVIWFITLSLLILSQTAAAESDKRVRNQTRKTDPQTGRRYATYDTNREYSRMRVRGSRGRSKDIELRVGVLGGLSKLSNSDTDTQAAIEQEKQNQNLFFGIGGEFRASYFGMELDTYYGIAPKVTLDPPALPADETADPTLTEEPEESSVKSTQQYGTFFNVNGLYPMGNSSFRFIPKLGVGYGFVATKQVEQLNLDGAEPYSVQNQVSGPFINLGVEFDIAPMVIIAADYARSISATGKSTVTEGKITPEDTATGEPKTFKLEGSAFERVRIGTYFRVAPHLILGGQFILRGFKSERTFENVDAEGNLVESTGEVKESFNQVLGLIMYEL